MLLISGLLMVYYFVIIASFILSWVKSTSEGMMKFKGFIHKFTEPYMKHFRGISGLRFGMFDFSPVLGIIVLSFLLFLTQNLAAGVFLTWYDLVFWLVFRIWGFIAFLIMLLAIVMLIRLVTLYTMKESKPDWVDSLDRFLFPIVSRALGVFTNKTVAYPAALAILGIGLIAIRFLAGWGVEELLGFLKMRLDELQKLK
jgi:uncharacterized protein YggT (Ycf19 family)